MALKKYDTVSACDQGAELKLRDAKGELTGDTITLAGVDSTRFREAQNRIGNARVRNRAAELTMEDMAAEGVALLADCTLGWSITDDEGQAVPFSRAAAVELYTSHPRIKEQANAFVGNLSNFLRD